MEEQMAISTIQEAASAGLKSMEHLLLLLSSSSYNSSSSTHNNNNLDCSEITDFTVSKFKQVINLLNRTGHARFRRAPPPQNPKPQQQPQIHELTLDFVKPNNKLDETDLSISTTNTNSSFLSSITADASVSDGKIGPFLTPSATAKPPLSSSHRKRCHDAAPSSSSPCHCSKKRYLIYFPCFPFHTHKIIIIFSEISIEVVGFI